MIIQIRALEFHNLFHSILYFAFYKTVLFIIFSIVSASHTNTFCEKNSPVFPWEVPKCHLSVCFKLRAHQSLSSDRPQRGKRPRGLWVTLPVISHGIAGAHSGAGIAGPSLGIVLFPPGHYQAPQVAAKLPQFQAHSEAQYLQQTRLQAGSYTDGCCCRRPRTRFLFDGRAGTTW